MDPILQTGNRTAKSDFLRRDEFDILGQLEHSGRSRVYRVVSKRGRLKNRVMALKVTPSEHPQANMHKSLHHPNIVSLFSYFSDTGTYSYLLEYCHGGNVQDYLECLGQSGLCQNEFKSLARSMASALVYLQSKCIIHRSINPRSILISTNHTFKLHNFQDAAYFCDRVQEPCNATTVTPYSAPEIAAQEPYSYSADVWSLGCVLLAACTGPQSVESLPKKVEDLQLPEETVHLGQRQALLGGLLRKVPGERTTPIQILSQHWVMPRIEFEASLSSNVENRNVEETELGPTQDDAPSSSEKKSISAGSSSLGKGYPSMLSRTQDDWKRVAAARSVSQPTFRVQPSNEATYLGLRSFSESVDRERLVRFFMGPVDHANNEQESQSQNRQRRSDTGSWNGVSLVQNETLDLSILPPKEYKVQRGSIDILPSGSFIIDFRSTITSPDGFAAEEILLVDPVKRDVQIHPLPSRAAVGQAKLTKPRHEYSISELPEPHNKIYLEALALLEEIKQRTPMLILHMVDGKCTMMCNPPLPDIEILLRVTPPAIPTSSKSMFRIRLFRRLQRLELAQRTSNEKSSEWLKKIVSSTDHYPFVQEADWDSLHDLEKRGLIILKKFILVCDTALELGLQPIEPGEDTALEDTLNEESTFDSSFMPSFAPELASSLPPRPLKMRA